MNRRLFTRLLTSTAILAILVNVSPVAGQAPQGATVKAGSVSITTQGSTTVVTQSTDKGIIDWRSFSVGPQESVRFDQPGRSSVTLNRVTGSEISRLDGSVSATGQVWLANPNGVLIGTSGQINVGGLLATTGRIDAAEFLRSGRAQIDQIGKDAALINKGSINIAEGGYAALAAAAIRNEGVIAARTGSVALGAGKAVTVDFAGDKLITFQVTQPLDQAPAGADAAITSGGTIAAAGGTVLMSARAAKGVMDSVINLTGHVIANTVAIDGGTVIFGESGIVKVSGKIDASNASGAGGSVSVLGATVGLMDGASIDASGATGGGIVLIGGDWQGGGGIGAAGRNAQVAYVAPSTSINVDATQSGTGGKAVVWADDTTRFNGTISARGGTASGDGGQVETSGKRSLQVGPAVRVTATNRAATAKPGEWLLDPNDITITNSTDNNIIGSPNFIFSFAGNSVLTVATINSALAGGSNVSVRTSSNGVDGSGGNGDISFTNGTITTSFSGSAVSLKLLADRNIVLASGTKIDLTGNTHSIVLASRANSGADGAVNISGTVQTAGGAITVGGGPAGTLSAIGNAASSNVGIRVQTTGTVASNGGAIRMTADGANLAGGSFGLYLEGNIQSGAGSIDITGTGVGQAGPSNVHGVLISGATIAATSAGTITITGARGLGNFSSNILVNSSSTISTVNGALTLNGTSFLNGGSTSNFGVALNQSTIQATGTGSIFINGNGASAGTATDYGVAIGLGNATFVGISGTGTGTISIKGNGSGTAAGLSMNQGTVSTSNGSAVFITDALTLNSQVISIGGASTTFRTFSSGSSIGVNGGAGGLSLSNSFLNSVGTASQIIGDTSMTGTINVGTGYVISRAMAFKGGNNTINFAGPINADGASPRSLQIDNSGTVSFGGAVGGLTPLASLIVNSGTSYLNGGVTTDFATNGSIFFSGRTILNANATLTTNNSRIVLGQVDAASNGGQSLTVAAGTGTVSFTSTVGSVASLASLSASGTGGTTVTGTVSTTGTQSYAGQVLLAASTTFTTGGPTITFGGTFGTNAAGVGATVTGTGNVSFVGVVGGGTTPLASLMLSNPATTTLNGPVTATTQSYGGGIVLNNDATITAANGATFSGVNSAAGTARSLTVVSTVNGATANFGVFGIGGATALQTLSVTTNNAAVNFPGMTAANLTVSTAGGTIGQTGGFNISGTANFSTGAGLIDLGSLNSNDFATVLVNTTGNAGIRDGTAGMALGASQINGTLTLTGASGGTVTQSGALSTTNLVLLGTGANFVMTNGSNSLLNLAGDTGSINISHAAANTFNTANINGTNGVTTSGPFTFNNGTQTSNFNSPVSAGGAVTLTAGFFNGSGGITTPALTIATPAGVLTNVVVNGQTGAAAAALVTLLSGAVSINGVALTATVASTPSTPSVATVASVPTVASLPSTPTLASVASLPSIVSVANIAPSVPSVVSLPMITFVPPLIIAPIVTTPQFFVLTISDLPPISQILPQIPAPNFNLALPEIAADAPRAANNAADRVALVTNTPTGALIPLGPRAVSETNAPLSSTATIKVDALDTGGSNGQVVAFGIGVAPGRDGSTIIVPGLLSERGLGPVDNASSLTSLSQQVPTMNDEALMD